MAVTGAALEPRITAVVSVCGLAPWRELPERQTANLIQPYNYPRLAPYATEGIAPLDMDHVAACLAPRPFLNLSAREDGTFPNIAEQQAALQQIAALYATLGHADRFAAVWADGPHAYGPAAARETEAWLHRWLWSGSAPACGKPIRHGRRRVFDHARIRTIGDGHASLLRQVHRVLRSCHG